MGLSGLYRGELGLKAGLDPPYPPGPGEFGELCGLKAPPEKGLDATGEKALEPNGVLIPGLAPGLNLRRVDIMNERQRRSRGTRGGERVVKTRPTYAWEKKIVWCKMCEDFSHVCATAVFFFKTNRCE